MVNVRATPSQSHSILRGDLAGFAVNGDDIEGVGSQETVRGKNISDVTAERRAKRSMKGGSSAGDGRE